ncbi:hypothetical protein R1sor_017567 [Riccia sorocarpa]|uniref:Pectinesterase n=1 Tax=Riccia sorocarpa TaxID=122646 RepID=A0ABD3IAX7_9MARC
MERFSVVFAFCFSCLVISGALRGPPLQFATAFAMVDEEWLEPVDFPEWLEYVHSTSDPEPTILDGMAPTGSYLGAGLTLPDTDQHAEKSSPGNLFVTKREIVVDQLGTGDFRTIQAAVNAVTNNNQERVTIRIMPGLYSEKVRIPKDKPYITLLGYPNTTVIVFDSIASDVISTESNATLRTFGSATVAVESRFFFAINLIFKNSAPIPPPGSVGKQAVAFRISADMAAFYNCQFLGGQDTLYDHHGRHYFQNCYVEGTIDFIFGNGRSLYKNCILNALDNYGAPGSITAQKRNPRTLDTGFSFVDCYVTGTGQVYLGRAWGNYSRVIFARSYMDAVVVPVGWDDWGVKDRDRTAFYAEFNCSGPGAKRSGRAPWARVITAKKAKPFLSSVFINGRKWLPRDYRDLINFSCSSAACGASPEPSASPRGSPPKQSSFTPSEIRPSAGHDRVFSKFDWSKTVTVAVIAMILGFFM